jgi:sortase A
MTAMTPRGPRPLSVVSAAALAALAALLASGRETSGESDFADVPVFEVSTTTPPVATPPTTASPSAPATVPPASTPASTPATVPPATVPPATVSPATVPPASTPATVVLPLPAAPPDPDDQEPLVEIGRIEIPRIALDQPLHEGITLGTLDAGPGHWPGTAMPGQIGNVVVAGHRVSHSRPFLDIDQLQPGDEMILTTADGRFVYLVSGTEVVTPDAIRVIDQTPAATATLIACHPPGSTKYRYIVHLSLASAETVDG